MSLDHNFLAEEQIEPLVKAALAYIQNQRQRFLSASVPLTKNERIELGPFFPSWALDIVRLSRIESGLLDHPAFLSQLNEIGFSYPDLNSMDAVTFRDVVVFIKDPAPGVLFHELVHVVQYQQLGLGGFADRYVRGLLRSGRYMAIPLEVHAYQLNGRYLKNPGAHFSVVGEVDEWILRRAY